MRKLKKLPIISIVCFILCFVVLIFVPVFSAASKKGTAVAEGEMTVLNIWQIDSFEGGKGSRASYLQRVGNEFSKTDDCYITLTTLTSAAARENLKAGNIPDLISYGAGTFGLEAYIKDETPYYTWCNGGYCILSIDTNANFEDVTIENTVINGGTENLSAACALLCGLNGAAVDKPTGAYVKLINGKYKYLLGTQRDIFRLRTRNAAFVMKPVTQFNDLYQNISITATDAQKRQKAKKFIKKLLGCSQDISKLGLMASGLNLYEDEMRTMEGVEYECKLVSPVSEQAKTEINSAILNNDIKKLKNLLN